MTGWFWVVGSEVVLLPIGFDTTGVEEKADRFNPFLLSAGADAGDELGGIEVAGSEELGYFGGDVFRGFAAVLPALLFEADVADAAFGGVVLVEVGQQYLAVVVV